MCKLFCGKYIKEIARLEQVNQELETQLSKFQPGLERPSPQGVITKEETRFNDEFTINRKLVRMEPTGTDSMDPLFDKGDLVIGLGDFDHKSLIVGDVVVYDVGRRYIVHRICSITEDDDGRLYRLTGDNNAGEIDPYLVRDSHIKYLVVGVIYLKKEGN